MREMLKIILERRVGDMLVLLSSENEPNIIRLLWVIYHLAVHNWHGCVPFLSGLKSDRCGELGNSHSLSQCLTLGQASGQRGHGAAAEEPEQNPSPED